MPAIRLESVPFNFQDVYTGTADQAIEGPKIIDITGEGTQSVQLADPAPKTVELIVRGDGAIGPNAFQVVVDAHVGEGEVPLITEFEYDVISPDATSISFVKTRREPIPK